MSTQERARFAAIAAHHLCIRWDHGCPLVRCTVNGCTYSRNIDGQENIAAETLPQEQEDHQNVVFWGRGAT